MNITKRIKKFFSKTVVEIITSEPDRSIEIDWVKRDELMTDRNKSRTFGF